jgi:hypothetical protein
VDILNKKSDLLASLSIPNVLLLGALKYFFYQVLSEQVKEENVAHTFLCFAKAQLSDDLKTQNLHSYGIRPLQATAAYYNYVRGAVKGTVA